MGAGREPIDEEYRRKLEALRAVVIEGGPSGPPEPFDFDAFIAERRAEHARKSRKRPVRDQRTAPRK